MNNMTTKQLIDEEIYRAMDSFLTEAKDQNGNERTLERLNADRHLFVDKMLTIISQATKEAVEECQKEMYRSLDEVAQYDKVFGDVKLVNKEDIKVWIHSLSNPHSKDKMELKYCEYCLQMTNSKNSVCLKHNLKQP